MENDETRRPPEFRNLDYLINSARLHYELIWFLSIVITINQELFCFHRLSACSYSYLWIYYPGAPEPYGFLWIPLETKKSKTINVKKYKSIETNRNL